jgi:CRP/FNR family cyclic AMP-dependent transcriptional regulator
VIDAEVQAAVEAGPLGDLPASVVGRLLTEATLIRLSAGGTLYRPGQHVGLHLVVNGLVRVAMTSEEGRSITVRYARSGDVLGVPVLVSGAAPVTAHAVTEATLCATPQKLLAALAHSDVRVALWLADELARRVNGLLIELGRSAFLPVRARVARHLLDLATDVPSAELVARVTQNELADAVGSVREVVTRSLGVLRRDGLIEQRAEGIRILDAGRLAEVADAEARATPRAREAQG